METIGQRIRKRRKELGLSARDLARAAGLAPATLSELENGDSKSSTRLHRIAAALGVEVETLDPPQSPRKGARTPIQAQGETFSEGASPAQRLDLPKLRVGFGIVANYFKAREAEFQAGDDLDLLALAYEWTFTRDYALMARIDAEIEKRVQQRGGFGGESKQGEVVRA